MNLHSFWKAVWPFVVVFIMNISKMSASPDSTFEGVVTDNTSDYPWVRRGVILFMRVSPDSERIVSLPFYKEPGKGVVLSLTLLENIAFAVRTEIGNNAEVDFVRGKLPEFLEACLLQTQHVLLAKQLRTYVEADGKMELAKRRKGWANLVKYCTGYTVYNEVNSWRVDFHVMTSRGGVERWVVAGSMAPFALDRVETIVVEREGTFEMFTMTRDSSVPHEAPPKVTGQIESK